MTKILYKILLASLLVSLLQCSKVKEIPKPKDSYALTINKISINNKTSIDTVYYSITPKDDKKIILQIDSLGNSSWTNSNANVSIVSQTETYVLVKRTNNFNNLDLKIDALAYGSVQSSVTIPYANGTINTGGNTSGTDKILFQAGNEWVVWDLKNNKKLYSTSLYLNIVDYNSQTGMILVLNGSYLQFYNENFTKSTITDFYSYYLNYAFNIRFSGSGNDVSFVENYYNYGRNFDSQGTLSSNNYMYDYNSNNTKSIYAELVYSSNSGYYNLNYVKNGAIKTIESSYYKSDFTNYNLVEVSKDGKYILYNYGSNLNVYNTSNSSKKTIYYYNYNTASFNSTTSKICYLENSELAIYDINSNSISYPLQNTSYGNSYIYYTFW